LIVKHIKVKNFRNYEEAHLELVPGRNILIGENAQGKTNLLEALEIIATGRSSRAAHERELISRGASQASIEVTYEAFGYEETADLVFTQGERLSRRARLNGVAQSAGRRPIGRIATVSFKAGDLNLLRGGPAFRRDLLDDLSCKLKPSRHELFERYEKVLQQRNRLLKILAEEGRVSSANQEQLLVWDKQLAHYGALIVTLRVELLVELLPIAQKQQEVISGCRESLGCDYVFKIRNEDENEAGFSLESLRLLKAEAIGQLIYENLKGRRGEEIARKQTLTGPHRDDLQFSLNDFAATAYASQGQQRSLVLALKLAELELLACRLEESPVLLLDDVLAELDLLRQGALMGLVDQEMQTLITTTHLDGFPEQWLERALIARISQGKILSA
jgi:DNA replication and repair protein RecF